MLWKGPCTPNLVPEALNPQPRPARGFCTPKSASHAALNLQTPPAKAPAPLKAPWKGFCTPRSPKTTKFHPQTPRHPFPEPLRAPFPESPSPSAPPVPSRGSRPGSCSRRPPATPWPRTPAPELLLRHCGATDPFGAGPDAAGEGFSGSATSGVLSS